MAKYCGTIGFAEYVDDGHGVWTESITERTYYGEIVRSRFQYQKSGSAISNFNITNSFSVVADPYICQNMPYLRYVTYNGTKWSVVSAEMNRPRVTIDVGGVYNDQT